VLDERFHRGIQKFNKGFFFEAHDVLEDLWHDYREDDRSFLQGLIQVAVGFYHLEGGNLKGARSQLSKGIAKLLEYGQHHQGIELGQFVGRLQICLDSVEQVDRVEAAGLKQLEIPLIHYHQRSHSQGESQWRQ
jgi:predicted metal-dependent hydrolase